MSYLFFFFLLSPFILQLLQCLLLLSSFEEQQCDTAYFSFDYFITLGTLYNFHFLLSFIQGPLYVCIMKESEH